ncbi:hypothetical protein NA56DRAFT_710448 [Hyaloscypha hepaticicola]|uniref:Uncharacterized protein n=1 Tax=Hyaloscypha hepaticicola TaxID=2082293 RepID=A0A2J6PLV1_9HELO|nr:hypothetical protein NA56DRAFT_710448 [Hyaloscypha hepaticicola]
MAHLRFTTLDYQWDNSLMHATRAMLPVVSSLATEDVAACEELASRLRKAKEWHDRVSTGPRDSGVEGICNLPSAVLKETAIGIGASSDREPIYGMAMVAVARPIEEERGGSHRHMDGGSLLPSRSQYAAQERRVAVALKVFASSISSDLNRKPGLDLLFHYQGEGVFRGNIPTFSEALSLQSRRYRPPSTVFNGAGSMAVCRAAASAIHPRAGKHQTCCERSGLHVGALPWKRTHSSSQAPMSFYGGASPAPQGRLLTPP